MVEADAPESAVPSGLDLVLLEKRARRRRLLIALAGLALLTGIVAGGLSYQSSENRREVDVAFGALSKCLLGPPLEPGELASARLRRVQLTAAAVPIDERGKPGEPTWPKTCATHSHKIAETARAAGLGDSTSGGLGVAAETLAGRLKEDDSLTANLSSEIDHVWAEAGAAKVSDVAAPAVPSPPDAADPYDVDALRTVPSLSPKSFALDAIQPSPYSTDVLRFVVDDKDVPHGPALCRLDGKVSDGPSDEPKLTCRTLSATAAKVTPGLRLWGTAEHDLEPWIFAGDRGAGGIIKPDGTSPAAVMTYGAHARADGTLDYLFWDEGESKVRRGRVGGDADETLYSTDDVGNPYYSVGLLWGHILRKGWSKSGGLALFSRPVDAETGDEILVGELAEPGRVSGSDDFPHISGCRTDDAIIARVRGRSGDQLAFMSDGKWQPPLFAPGLDASMTCRGNEVSLTRLGHGTEGRRYAPTVYLNRCSAAACNEKQISMKEITRGIEDLLPQSPKHVEAASVGRHVLVVWNPGEPYGARMKVGPIEQLARLPMTTLFDDLRQEQTIQSPSTLFGLRILTRGDLALIFVSSLAGVHVLQVDPEGKITPVAVDWVDANGAR